MDSGGRAIDGANGDEKSLESGGGGGNTGYSHHFYNHHRRLTFHHFLWVLMMFLTIALSCLVLYHTTYPFQFFPKNSYNPPSPANKNAELERVLKEAATKDKTVILTTLNKAWAEPNSIFDVFLEGFKIGNGTKKFLNNLVVIALDREAYARCAALHPHCFDLSTDGTDFSGEADFMSPEYLKMMWRRIDFLHTVLDLGYNFVFTDTDIMWFRDPFPHFYSDADFQIACDFFRGNPSDLNNQPNGGYNYVKSNTHTIKFYEFWYNSSETYPGLHDQDVLNKIKYDPYLSEIGITIKFLDTAYFGGICEPSRDFNKVCTMHANCCVGLDNKIHDLKIMLDDWRKYSSAKTNETAPSLPSWTVPQRCGAASWGSLKPSKKNNTEGGTKR
ncbi:hypothetical protein LguiA_033639 [Lonicera macranthoides]